MHVFWSNTPFTLENIEQNYKCCIAKARFPLGEFVRATRSENKNPATWLVKIGWRKNSPRTSRKRSYFFVCSREQIRLVENGLNVQIICCMPCNFQIDYDRYCKRKPHSTKNSLCTVMSQVWYLHITHSKISQKRNTHTYFILSR